ncbi:MAG TPA: TRAP transporter small permease [Bosea sp. (in: a-proteobacteria)]|jgi:TRAP-type C4-dicarboxylate transport system permease small subunit|uniref:TRAP transporter small permease n=1 Tax=Bosea sp. (in: a-proteobacteria) TaxID=1871050 RepID=UPI002E129CF5|nr:TRAP transporter small permease [Bosea sp. (in: a-proteobacteria)]
MRFLYRPDLPEPAPLRWLGDMVDVALTLLAAMLLVVMFANVAARVALNSDLAWNTEFGEFVLLWATFLGGASAARRGAHMRITEFTDKMPPTLQKVVELATRLGVVALLTLLISYGWNITESTMGQELTVLHVPMGLQYLAMPVGSALALVFVLYEMALLLRNKPLPQEAFQD